MKLLGWDTSSKAGAIVALEWPEASPDLSATQTIQWDSVRLVAEWSLNVDSQHSDQLLWGIHQTLQAARWKLSDIDVFAVGIGPGSFTGIRIGITTARTLAHSMEKPLLGVSSLAALARPVALGLKAWSRGQTMVIASTDAAKGELFCLWGEASAVGKCAVAPESVETSAGSKGPAGPAGNVAGLWSEGVTEAVVAPGELIDSVQAWLVAGPDRTWAVMGEGRNRYRDEWARLPANSRLEIPAAFAHQVEGRYLGMLAWEAWHAGLARPALTIHPRYLRASDAEVKLRAGLLKSAPMFAPGSAGTKASEGASSAPSSGREGTDS